MSVATPIGTTFAPAHHVVEREHIRAFAAALGDANPLYHDVATAHAAGYPDLVAPPTFATRWGLWANRQWLAELDRLGWPLIRMLHGEQEYHYHAPVFAGDQITAVIQITAIKQTSGSAGRLTLLTLETTYTNQHGVQVVSERMVVVVRNAHV